MRIHTDLDIETFGQLSVTPKLRGQVYLERFYEYGSRSHARAFDTNLRGLHNLTPDGVKRRRPNSGQRGAGNDWAATYDEWGWFLAALYEVDPTAKCAGAYKDRDDFHQRTEGKYLTEPDPAKVIPEVIADLTGMCIGSFCNGPDEPFESMVTCRVCASVQALRQLV